MEKKEYEITLKEYGEKSIKIESLDLTEQEADNIFAMLEGAEDYLVNRNAPYLVMELVVVEEEPETELWMVSQGDRSAAGMETYDNFIIANNRYQEVISETTDKKDFQTSIGGSLAHYNMNVVLSKVVAYEVI